MTYSAIYILSQKQKPTGPLKKTCTTIRRKSIYNSSQMGPAWVLTQMYRANIYYWKIFIFYMGLNPKMSIALVQPGHQVKLCQNPSRSQYQSQPWWYSSQTSMYPIVLFIKRILFKMLLSAALQLTFIPVLPSELCLTWSLPVVSNTLFCASVVAAGFSRTKYITKYREIIFFYSYNGCSWLPVAFKSG